MVIGFEKQIKQNRLDMILKSSNNLYDLKINESSFIQTFYGLYKFNDMIDDTDFKKLLKIEKKYMKLDYELLEFGHSQQKAILNNLRNLIDVVKDIIKDLKKG